MKNLSPNCFLLLKQIPSAKAIVTSTSIYTFDELKLKVLNTAGYLKKQNISSGDCVGVIGQNDIHFVINILALWQLSAVPYSINTRLTNLKLKNNLLLQDVLLYCPERNLVEELKILEGK
jgi:acyl-CoA synthetase (AMP-forming)/AMP-acid ligase II